MVNKRIKLIGKFVHRHGVETGDYPVLEISSIKEVKVSAEAAHASPPSLNLAGTEWRLEDIAGQAAYEHSQATLAFQGAEKVSVNGSCNRFFGPGQIHGDSLKLGPFASSRMCLRGAG